jgi:hypothetical protein
MTGQITKVEKLTDAQAKAAREKVEYSDERRDWQRHASFEDQDCEWFLDHSDWALGPTAFKVTLAGHGVAYVFGDRDPSLGLEVVEIYTRIRRS